MKFRKRPVVVDAELFADDVNREATAVRLARWCGGDVRYTYDDGVPVPHIEIRTLEGTMHADPGDWVIRGVEGEFYPCKPAIFAATYEAVAQ